MAKQIQLSYLPCVKYSAKLISISCRVDGNVNDEERLPLMSIFKGMYISSPSFFFFFFFFFFFYVHVNQKRREEFLSWPGIFRLLSEMS